MNILNSELNLLPLAASICLIIALIEAWVLTAVRYLRWNGIKKIFPNYRDLVRSHIDYLIMSAIVFGVYLVLKELSIRPPESILWLTFVGALYNPFGFILQAMKPDIVGNDLFSKVGVVIGFLPLSIGLGWCSVEIMLTSLDKL